MIRVVQISDCHISADPEAVYRGINPRANLEAVLEKVKDWNPDWIFLTGDLAEDADPKSYAYIKSVVSTLDVPVFTLPGNHDDAIVQAQAFPHTAVNDPVCVEQDDWRVILLNSTRPGAIEGHLSARMLEGLQHLMESSTKPTVVMLHHQPVLVGSSWIDKYALQAPERLWSVMDSRPQLQAVVWGHIHHEFMDQKNGAALISAPSTAANAVPGKDRFCFDDAGPACRWFTFADKGNFQTGLLRA